MRLFDAVRDHLRLFEAIEMNGIPDDLDLSTLHGAEVIQVCLGIWQVHVNFKTGASLSVNGDWEMVDERGEIIDRSSDTLRSTRSVHLHLLLGRLVKGTAVDSPLSLSLTLTGNLVFRVTVSDRGYECCSIEPLRIVL
jgi:hypothetical protein